MQRVSESRNISKSTGVARGILLGAGVQGVKNLIVWVVSLLQVHQPCGSMTSMVFYLAYFKLVWHCMHTRKHNKQRHTSNTTQVETATEARHETLASPATLPIAMA